MKPIEKLRQKLLAQRRALFEQVARAADDLRWLDTNTHPETEEEAQEQSIARLLARLERVSRPIGGSLVATVPTCAPPRVGAPGS